MREEEKCGTLSKRVLAMSGSLSAVKWRKDWPPQKNQYRKARQELGADIYRLRRYWLHLVTGNSSGACGTSSHPGGNVCVDNRGIATTHRCAKR